MRNKRVTKLDTNEIVVIGLGYVGFAMAANLLDRGFKVCGARSEMRFCSNWNLKEVSTLITDTSVKFVVQ